MFQSLIQISSFLEQVAMQRPAESISTRTVIGVGIKTIPTAPFAGKQYLKAYLYSKFSIDLSGILLSAERVKIR